MIHTELVGDLIPCSPWASCRSNQARSGKIAFSCAGGPSTYAVENIRVRIKQLLAIVAPVSIRYLSTIGSCPSSSHTML